MGVFLLHSVKRCRLLLLVTFLKTSGLKREVLQNTWQEEFFEMYRVRGRKQPPSTATTNEKSHVVACTCMPFCGFSLPTNTVW